jgi:crotonobetainyl-CoA:carnitine CoA-transferase CaiB-like acyl-CoA transferase
MGVVRQTMAEKALEGLKVVELASMVAGPYCSKLMADLGADVIKVEPPTGDPARQRGPFPNNVPNRERSGLFLYLNTSKRGVTLDVETATGRELLARLVRWADVLVEDNPPSRAEALGLDYPRLRQLNQSLVVTSITPFGQTGPNRDLKAYPLNVFHAGGEGSLIPVGPQHLDKPPVRAGSFVSEYDAAVNAAVATLAAVYWQRATGQGQHVDVSKQESSMAICRITVGKYTSPAQMLETRATRRRRMGNLIPCKDGYLEMMPHDEHFWQGMLELMGHPDWENDPRFATNTDRAVHTDELNELLTDWAKDHTKEEIYVQGQQVRVPVGMVSTPADVMSNEQLQHRQFFVEIDHPETGRLRYPSAPYRFSETPWQASRPAPRLGEHNLEVYHGQLGYATEDVVKMSEAGVL